MIKVIFSDINTNGVMVTHVIAQLEAKKDDLDVSIVVHTVKKSIYSMCACLL